MSQSCNKGAIYTFIDLCFIDLGPKDFVFGYDKRPRFIRVVIRSLKNDLKKCTLVKFMIALSVQKISSKSIYGLPTNPQQWVLINSPPVQMLCDTSVRLVGHTTRPTQLIAMIITMIISVPTVVMPLFNRIIIIVQSHHSHLPPPRP